MTLTFEAAEFAVIDAALDLLRASGCGRRREALLVEMAERVLANASARTRRRHAVVVEKDAATGEVAYVTGRGYLPARAEPAPHQHEQKKAAQAAMRAEKRGDDATDSVSSSVPTRLGPDGLCRPRVGWRHHRGKRSCTTG
jgi:hypothetical protein